MKLGPPIPVPSGGQGLIGPGQPCWGIAINPLGGDQWEPFAQLHECNRACARAIAVSIASTLNQTRILYGEVEGCKKNAHGGTTVALRNPTVLEAQKTPKAT